MRAVFCCLTEGAVFPFESFDAFQWLLHEILGKKRSWANIAQAEYTQLGYNLYHESAFAEKKDVTFYSGCAILRANHGLVRSAHAHRESGVDRFLADQLASD